MAENVDSTLKYGNFVLRKWNSNSQEFVLMSENVQKIVTVLGLVWDTENDTLQVKVPPGDVAMKLNKRSLMARLAQLFSPLGLVAPFVIKGKIRLARLHLLGFEWDQILNDKKHSKMETEEAQWWLNWLQKIEAVTKEKFSRCLRPDPEELLETELHCFMDASEEAFAAVIYTRNLYKDGSVKCNIVMAKTRVSPRKTLSVAKLELQAAVLGVRLMSYVQEGIRFEVQRRYFWTDSTCVRQWVRQTATFFKPFVSNRIGEIQMASDPGEWRHLPGKQNVADEATRSEMDDVIISKRWKNGPDFLYEQPDKWPKDLPPQKINVEVRSKWDFTAFPAKVVQAKCGSVHYGSFEKLVRVTAWSIHFIRRFMLKKTTEQRLEEEDFTLAELHLLKQAQRQHYMPELSVLQEKKPIPRKSCLLPLTPFIDEQGLLRVGGRVGNSKLVYDAKHPIIMHPENEVSKLIMLKAHLEHKHAGVNYVLAQIKQQYWIIHGREALKKVRSKCERCNRDYAKPMVQIMAELPKERTTPCPPFERISLDFFGPVTVAISRNKTDKRYGALFVCMTTRAVHIEMAGSLSTPDFLNAFRTFCNLRGQPKYIYSDNGTNFQGAKNLLEDPKLQLEWTQKHIKWQMQPPQAPHFGGIHEALVKSSKRAMMQIMTDEQRRRNLKEAELRLLFSEVTNFLNARPLTYVGNDPEDLIALTPNHFLLNRANPAVPLMKTEPMKYRDNFQYVQGLTEEIWKIWLTQYLPSLTARAKWRSQERNLKVGDRVFVVQDNIKRGDWLWGLVHEVHPNSDGIVRKATVKTKTGMLVRPITKLCLLEEGPKEEG